jgi:hypothetical protein
MEWLLFLPQLPITPSSLRVNVWRKLGLAGALRLQSSAWLLPDRQEQLRFLQGLLLFIQSQGASGSIFSIKPLSPAVEQDLLARYQVGRDDEYGVLCQRAADFLVEIKRETASANFSFARLQKAEGDFYKLETALSQIQNRDVGGSLRAPEAVRLFKACQEAFSAFSEGAEAHLHPPLSSHHPERG